MSKLVHTTRFWSGTLKVKRFLMFIEFDYKSLVLGTHTQTSQLKKHKQTNEMKLMHAYIINNVVKLVYVFFFINLL